MNDIVKADNQVSKYSDKQVQLIWVKYAKGATKEEFELLLYTAQKYDLDILTGEIYLVKYENKPAMIFASRDGHLAIAHKIKLEDGQPAFDGMVTEPFYDDNKNLAGATCEVWRKDMGHSVKKTVLFKEYNTNMALWKSKPVTMIEKVAESQALRRAFHISGIFCPEEMAQWELEAQGIKFTPPAQQAIQSAPQQSTDFDWSKLDLEKEPNKKWNDKTKKYDVPMIKRLWAIKGKLGVSDEEFKTKTIEITGKEHSKDWIIKDCMLIDLWLKEVETGEADEPDIIEADIETASVEDYQELEKEFMKVNDEPEDILDYAQDKLGATPRSIADNMVKRATKGQ